MIDFVRKGLQEVIIVIVGLVILEQQVVKRVNYEILRQVDEKEEEKRCSQWGRVVEAGNEES